MESTTDGARAAHRRSNEISISPRLLTLDQAASYLNVPKADVRRFDIGPIKIGSRIRFDINAINAELDRLSGLDSIESSTADDAEAALARFNQGLSDAARRT